MRLALETVGKSEPLDGACLRCGPKRGVETLSSRCVAAACWEHGKHEAPHGIRSTSTRDAPSACIGLLENPHASEFSIITRFCSLYVAEGLERLAIRRLFRGTVRVISRNRTVGHDLGCIRVQFFDPTVEVGLEIGHELWP